MSNLPKLVDGFYVLAEPDARIEAMMDRQYQRVPSQRKWRGLAPNSPVKGMSLRGAGDLVKRVTDALGIPQCGGCEKRQEWLNAHIPFGSKE